MVAVGRHEIEQFEHDLDGNMRDLMRGVDGGGSMGGVDGVGGRGERGVREREPLILFLRAQGAPRGAVGSVGERTICWEREGLFHLQIFC